MAKLLTAKTPDLTRMAQHHGGKFPRAQVDGIISGETVTAGHGTREMPIWGPIFSQVSWDMDLGRVRIDNLARYLETLPGEVERRTPRRFIYTAPGGPESRS